MLGVGNGSLKSSGVPTHTCTEALNESTKLEVSLPELSSINLLQPLFTSRRRETFLKHAVGHLRKHFFADTHQLPVQ